MAAVLVERARRAGLFSAVTIGASFGCPFEGEVPVARLREVLSLVADAGPDEVALADTIGVAVPSDVTERVGIAMEIAGPGVASRLHLHDTRNTAVANAVAASRPVSRLWTRASAVLADAPLRRTQLGMSRPKTWSTCSAGWGSRPAWTSRD